MPYKDRETRAAAHAAYRKAHPELRRQWEKQQLKKNPARFKAKRRRHQMRKLVQKEEMAGRPRPNNCEICGRGGPIYFDHCHHKHEFRGWLCRGCNTTLGLMEDNSDWLRGLAEYVEKHGG